MKYRRTVVIVIGLLLFTFAGQSLWSLATLEADTPAAIQTDVAPSQSEIMRLINIERASLNKKPLVVDPLLTASAQKKADEMHKEDYYGHKNRSGVQGYSYAGEAVKACIYISENLAAVETAKGAFDGWKASKPHYEAMIDTKYDTTGIAIAKTKYGYYYVVQHFCDLP